MNDLMQSPQPDSANKNPANKPSRRHIAFEVRFIWWGLFFSAAGGFLLAALIAATQSFDFILGEFLFSYIQLHGFLQITAFTGCFILPVSLHFIPRLAGVPISRRRAPAQILALFVASLFLRMIASLALPFAKGIFIEFTFAVLFFSAVIFCTMILYYCVIIYTVIKNVLQVAKRPALPQVAPFFYGHRRLAAL